MSNRHVFEEQDPDGIVNHMDVTIVGEEPDNYDGVDKVNVEDSAIDDTISAAMALRKNLSGAFDLYASAGDVTKTIGTTKRSSVKDKIEAFERAAFKISSHIPAAASQEHEMDTEPAKLHTRPPALPIKMLGGKSSSKDATIAPSLLTVYLRIRPPTGGNFENGTYNTVEILADSAGSLQAESYNNHKILLPISNKIRTYPPSCSNSAKVLRGYSNHQNSMPLTQNSSTSENSGTIKGVKEFEFTRVFSPTTSQKDIYNEVAAPLVEGLFRSQSSQGDTRTLLGNSALLFAYGITNAGKTHTMVGKNIFNSSSRNKLDCNHDTDAGIIPRSLSHILQTLSSFNNQSLVQHSSFENKTTSMNRKGIVDTTGPNRITYHLYMSYFEIYNEQIFDLLPNEKRSRPGGLPLEESLKIRETRNGRTYVGGLAKHPVKDVATGIELLRAAFHKRRTCSNNINHDSSRSHSICQFEIVAITSHIKSQNIMDDEHNSVAPDATGYYTDEESGTSEAPIRKSVHMWIVDLAGSERSKRTGILHKASRQKESALINTSLMKLMRCFQVLAENQKSTSSSSLLVPFRESKLTHLFMAHLTGTPISRTSMIVNINPSVDDYDETQHVLSYAAVARNIKISEAEYFRKRRAIQISDGDSVHATVNQIDSEIRSPPRKLSRLVQKLSPRALLARRRQESLAVGSTKIQEKNTDISNGVEAENIKPRSSTDSTFNTLKELDEENKSLHLQLQNSQAIIEQLCSEKVDLCRKLDECESKVRMEVAEETEAQIIYLREQHNEIILRLRHQYQSNPTPSKSAKKAQSDKAAQMIEEYIEKIDECEEEMDRMRLNHESEVNELKTFYMQELEEKESFLSLLQNKLSVFEQEKLHTISTLEDSLAAARREIEVLRQDSDGLTNSSNIESSRPSSSDQEGFYDEDERVVRNKENFSSDTGHSYSTNTIKSPTAPSSVRRLPRPRCSEVACANISPNSLMVELTAKQSSSTKKRSGLISTITKSKEIRSPFKQGTNFKSDLCESLLDDDDIMYPSSQPEYDEITGRYQRPRGRAPQGRTWDSQSGGWRRVQ